MFNFVIFNEGDEIFDSDTPYLCSSPKSNVEGYDVPVVFVYKGNQTFTVYMDDVGIQFYINVDEKVYNMFANK